ncbi:META domain-containing protein [Sphingomonas cavernae]|uniref:META domain-containing protein n=1 Tax=Sphingomonas cavernae TaxID=2320861 RepID=A0A418WN34_9SPHN|nr:META domain-containing protein [Sphingomonas cavernae]RJF91413.1 META domain-containing protein [Sphingomonas cavernae]
MKTALPVAALLLAACSPTPPAGDAPPPVVGNYRAIGTEPGWTVTITPGQIEYLGNYGETTIVTPRPEPRATFNGHRYEAKTEAHSLVVDITHGQCSDGMSDRTYPDTVMVIADGKTVKGCGGPAVPPAKLAGTSWTIISIGGTAAAGDRPGTLAFSEDRLSGSSGCNRFSSPYAQTGDRLSISAVTSTKMACPGPAMEQESKLFEIFASEVRVSFRDGDTLVITGGNGGQVVLKRAI